MHGLFDLEMIAHVTIDSRFIYLGIKKYNQSSARNFITGHYRVIEWCAICNLSITGVGDGRPVY